MTCQSVPSPTVVTPPGLSPDAWRPVVESAPRVRLAQLARRLRIGTGARLVVFSARPDDETIGCGRLIAEWADQIGPCTAVLALSSLRAGPGRAACQFDVDLAPSAGPPSSQMRTSARESPGAGDFSKSCDRAS